MEDKSSCCFGCRLQVSCDKHTQHTVRRSTIYPDSDFIDSCKSYEPMFISIAHLAELCGTTQRIIKYALSKGDDYAIENIKKRFSVEIKILRDPTVSDGRARIVLKGRR